jgi:hypothetical protein
MVGAVKRWLGIDVLERENLQLAKALKTLRTDTNEHCDDLKKLGEDVTVLMADREKRLTSEQPKPKIVAKPAVKAVNWGKFRDLAELATEPEREEA